MEEGSNENDAKLTDDEKLLRLLWSASDFDEEGNVLPSSIRKDDLSGAVGEGVSVDRHRLANSQVIQERITMQRKRAELKDKEKGVPFITTLLVYKVRAIEVDGERLFGVVPDKVEATAETLANEAHALIQSLQRISVKSKNKKVRAQFNERRYRLVSLMSEPETWDKYMARSF